MLSLLLVGCTPVIKDRDFDAEEKNYIKEHGVKANDPLWQSPTSNIIQAAKEDGILITLFRDPDIKEGELDLQQWHAVLSNKTDEAKCIQSSWKLQDFQMYTDYPDFIKVQPYEVVYTYARMTQQIWLMDGIKLILPPSGYVASLDIRDPDDRGTCTFETDVVEM